jgi:4-amino-4-deoxy-L-arabinose transferase-like glycosyltransferase
MTAELTAAGELHEPRSAVLIGALKSLALAAAVMLAILPTLSWLEFSGSMENLNVATAMELRREGFKLVPTLEGADRVAKPPLAAWITASFIRASTMQALSSPQRESAYRALAFEVRMSGLLAGCITILLVYELGRLIGGSACGFASAAIFASNYAFLRFGRQATTDVHLMLWVTAANVLLAHALFKQRMWFGFIGAGVAMGVAFLSKGPVALLQTAAPVGLFLIWRQWKFPHAIARRFWLPMVSGVIAMLLVAAPWYLMVVLRSRDVTKRWWVELTQAGVVDAGRDPIFVYLLVIPLMMPWILPLVIGLIDAAKDAWSGRDRRIVLALFLLVVPLVTMSFFHDRKDRYMLPMIGPASVLAGAALSHTLRVRGRAENLLLAAQWGLLAVVAIGLPIAGMILKTTDGSAWLSGSQPVFCALAMLSIMVMGFARKRLGGIVTTGVVVMLLAQAVLMSGYVRTREGRSEMKPLAEAIIAAYPDALVYNGRHVDKRVPVDLAIYLNRATLRDEHWQELSPTDRPRVVVMPQRAGEPDPQPPAGWKFLEKTPRDRDFWWAFVLEPG